MPAEFKSPEGDRYVAQSESAAELWVGIKNKEAPRAPRVGGSEGGLILQLWLSLSSSIRRDRLSPPAGVLFFIHYIAGVRDSAFALASVFAKATPRRVAQLFLRNSKLVTQDSFFGLFDIFLHFLQNLACNSSQNVV